MRRPDYEIELHALRFKWDARKAERNRLKHGVTFEEAASVFVDALATVRSDPTPSDELRLQIMGYSLLGRLLLVVHVEVEDETTIRIISARRLTPKERRSLEDE